MRVRLREAALPGALACASILVTTPARAQPTVPLDLSWSAPPECPAGADVTAAVARLLEGSPRTGSRVRVLASVSRRGSGAWALSLTTTRDGAVGHRAMQADSCPAVADAAALIIALTIDPVHVAERPAVTPATTPTPPPPPAKPVAPPPKPAPMPPPPVVARPPAPAATPPAPPEAASPLSVALGASIAGDAGSIPGPAVGFQGSAALLVGRLRVEGYGAFWPNRGASASLAPAFGSLTAEVRLADGGALGCYALLATRWELSPCAGLELGLLGASGSNLGTSTPGSSFWAAARAEGRVALRVTDRFAVTAGVGLAVPLVRHSVVATGTNGSPLTLFAPGAVAGRAVLGPEVRF